MSRRGLLLCLLWGCAPSQAVDAGVEDAAADVAQDAAVQPLVDGAVDAVADQGADANTADGEVDAGLLMWPSGCEAQPAPGALDIEEAHVNGSRVLFVRPPPPLRGLLFVFHGKGGDARVFFDRVEAALFVEAALARGLAVVATESIERGAGAEWAEGVGPNNPDIVNTLATLQFAHDEGTPEDAPVYVAGGSNGGAYVSRLVQQLPVTAAFIFISRGIVLQRAAAHRPPTIFLGGENDPIVPWEDVQATHDRLADEDVRTRYLHNGLQALTPGRFTRIPGVDCPLSRAIGESLIAHGGVLDLQGRPTEGWTEAEWVGDLPAAAMPFEAEIEDQLQALWGGHAPTAEFNAEVLDFLLAP